MNRTVDNILVSVATIGLLIGAEHLSALLFKTNEIAIAIAFLVAGLFVLVFAKRLLNGNLTPLKSIMSDALGILLFVWGIELLSEHFLQYWWIMGIIGLVLFQTHHAIAERM